MELEAVIRALTYLEPSYIDLYCDSQYVLKGMSEWIPNWIKKNWNRGKKNTVKNLDKWKMLTVLAEKHKIKYHWVRGHNGDKYNEIVDIEANTKARSSYEEYLCIRHIWNKAKPILVKK